MDAKVLDILENCFEWNRDRKLIRKIRKEVEDFEQYTKLIKYSKKNILSAFK